MCQYRYQLTPRGRKLLTEQGIATRPRGSPNEAGWDPSSIGLVKWCRICGEAPEHLHQLVMAEDEEGEPSHSMWACEQCCKPPDWVLGQREEPYDTAPSEINPEDVKRVPR